MAQVLIEKLIKMTHFQYIIIGAWKNLTSLCYFYQLFICATFTVPFLPEINNRIFNIF